MKHLKNVTAVTIDERTTHFDRPMTMYAALTAHYKAEKVAARGSAPLA